MTVVRMYGYVFHQFTFLHIWLKHIIEKLS